MRRRRVTRQSDWGALIAAARQAAANAHAPYSELRVGAALEAEGGTIYRGCNVENSSLGLTVCAERAALCQAIVEGERAFRRLAIYTRDAGPLSPCGACRQALAEFCRELPIVSVGRGNQRREFALGDLLPEAFGWPAGEASGEQEV
jgi:cytidine deaminase